MSDNTRKTETADKDDTQGWDWEPTPPTPREQELEEELARARADLTNLLARRNKDNDAQYESGKRETLESLLPVMDNITGAHEHGDLVDENPLAVVVRNLARVLESQGLGEIGVVGERFDPRVHEAVSVERREDVEHPVITAVHQRGYGTRERLLRPAKVSIAKKP